jgi:hypothetical protein
MPPRPRVDQAPPADPATKAALSRIEEALRGLQFGHVTVFVQDGSIVLIERTEKQRI